MYLPTTTILWGTLHYSLYAITAPLPKLKFHAQLLPKCHTFPQTDIYVDFTIYIHRHGDFLSKHWGECAVFPHHIGTESIVKHTSHTCANEHGSACMKPLGLQGWDHSVQMQERKYSQPGSLTKARDRQIGLIDRPESK